MSHKLLFIEKQCCAGVLSKIEQGGGENTQSVQAVREEEGDCLSFAQDSHKGYQIERFSRINLFSCHWFHWVPIFCGEIVITHKNLFMYFFKFIVNSSFGHSFKYCNFYFIIEDLLNLFLGFPSYI